MTAAALASDDMDSEARVQAHHWALWARAERDGGPRIGYPSRVPWYTQARSGNVYEAPKGWQDVPSAHDEHLAELIGAGVQALAQVDPLGASVLRERWGAYPGAPIEQGRRTARCARILNRHRSRVTEFVNHAQGWVEGWVSARVKS